MAPLELEHYLRDGNRSYRGWLEACVECLTACERGSEACFDDDPTMMARCTRLDWDCADACAAALRAMAGNGPRRRSGAAPAR